MDVISFLRMDAEMAHWEFNGTTADVTAESLHHGPRASEATVASAMAHVVFAEDNLIHGIFQGKQPLATTTFTGKTGISEPSMMNSPEWVKSVRLDLGPFREYTAAVFNATEQYIAALKESDLDRELDLTNWGMGKVSLGWGFAVLLIGHIHDITGEISALKGAQGFKGYPF